MRPPRPRSAFRQLEALCFSAAAAINAPRAPATIGGSILRRTAAGSASPSAPPIVHEVLRSPGRPLEASTKAFMESALGLDFGDVRVPTDERSEWSARAVSALAYTVGSDVVFGDGTYWPGVCTRMGQSLEQRVSPWGRVRIPRSAKRRVSPVPVPGLDGTTKTTLATCCFLLNTRGLSGDKRWVLKPRLAT